MLDVRAGVYTLNKTKGEGHPLSMKILLGILSRRGYSMILSCTLDSRGFDYRKSLRLQFEEKLTSSIQFRFAKIKGWILVSP